MENIIEELIGIIAQEIDAFDALLKTLHGKQRAIVEGAIERLSQTVQDEQHWTSKTKSLEAERVERSQQLARELALENLNPKLNEIIEQVEEKYAQRLTEQRELLRAIIDKIQNLNRSNQFLLNYSLKFIDKSMELLLNSSEKLSVYEKSGKLQNHKISKVLDQCV